MQGPFVYIAVGGRYSRALDIAGPGQEKVLAHAGIAGGSGYGSSAANNGATVAEIYDPSKPIGSRWSVVADSQIWRMYHSTAFLTSNAEVTPFSPPFPPPPSPPDGHGEESEP